MRLADATGFAAGSAADLPHICSRSCASCAGPLMATPLLLSADSSGCRANVSLCRPLSAAPKRRADAGSSLLLRILGLPRILALPLGTCCRAAAWLSLLRSPSAPT